MVSTDDELLAMKIARKGIMKEARTKKGQRRLVTPSIRPFREPFRNPISDLPEGWQDAFLEELRMEPLIARAARIAGVSRRTVYTYKEHDPEFAAAWDDAELEGKERALEMLSEQAKQGVTLALVQLIKIYGYNLEVKEKAAGEKKTFTVGWAD